MVLGELSAPCPRGDPEAASEPQFPLLVETDEIGVWGGGRGGLPFFCPSHQKTWAESDELGGRFRPGPLKGPCEVLGETVDPRGPHIHQEVVPFALWSCGEEGQTERGPFCYCESWGSPGNARRNPHVPLPHTMELSRAAARRGYHGDGPCGLGRPDQRVCGEASALPALSSVRGACK